MIKHEYLFSLFFPRSELESKRGLSVVPSEEHDKKRTIKEDPLFKKVFRSWNAILPTLISGFITSVEREG